MKRQTKKHLIKILCSVVMLISVSACSSSDDVLDEGHISTEGDIAEALKSVNTEWGTSKEAIQQHMNGYQLIESADESILQFNAKRLPVTIAYQFTSDRLCAAVIMTKKGEEKVDINKTLYGFSYVGESGSNAIYSNKDKNVFAVSYETVDNEDNYQVIGFTSIFPKTENVNGKECTDLGLSVKWAICNIGARSPEGYGGYFAWGEIEEKDIYSWNTYKYCSGSSSTCENIGDNIGGTQYDVAQAVWGNPWTMPTKEEIKELLTKCDWVWTAENGIKGFKVFGDNGNYIFLPAAGLKSNSLNSNETYGFYRTATQYKDKTSSEVWELSFSSSKKSANHSSKYYGESVRAVCKHSN